MFQIIRKYALMAAMGVSGAAKAQGPLPLIKISENNRYFSTFNGEPFFWLGDTGWLLFTKCTREEAVQYLETRKQQGFNVVQSMVLHELKQAKNVYGDLALDNQDVAKPNVTPGNNFKHATEYDYWDHVEFVVDEAAKRGIYMALVPVWGSNIKAGFVNAEQARAYGQFLGERFKDKTNIIWLNGGDIKGGDALEVWNALGESIKQADPNHIMTFHPRGRNSSSEWFHDAKWLDFNMFQSGHKNYAQDTVSTEKLHYGEDNWKYINSDYERQPVKPTIDGEPSYENIPYGLHDYSLPRWKDADLRRYAYWSVFAGGAGFTYGENSIMQFYKKGDKDGNYGAMQNWKETIEAPGARQMQFLKKLMLGKSYFDRVPAQDIVMENTGDKYNYILATKGSNYALLYTYTGVNIKVDMKKLGFTASKAYWYNPKDGSQTLVPPFKKDAAIVLFDPPNTPANGNDWVLVIE